MLPVDLSHDTYSLVPEQKRPALICRMHIGRDGTINQFEFAEALIRSQSKLSYQGVYDALTAEASSLGAPAHIHDMLVELKAFAQKMLPALEKHLAHAKELQAKHPSK